MTKKLEQIMAEIKSKSDLDESNNELILVSNVQDILEKHLSTSKEEEPNEDDIYNMLDTVQKIFSKTHSFSEYAKQIKDINEKVYKSWGHKVYVSQPTPEQQSDKPTKIELFVDNSAKGITTVKHMIQKINEIIDYINNKD